MTVERATELAFRGDLDRALNAIARIPRSDDARWLRAYVASARGRFSEAERTLVSLRTGSEDPVILAKAAVTLGSVLRQTERHGEARAIERDAFTRAPSEEFRAHLSIGLAADAVGLGELAEVDAMLRRVGARPPGGWRAIVRMQWVRCERNLLAGRPAAAAGHARKALDASRRAAARRHAAKSNLFLGVSLLEAGRAADGRRALGLALLGANKIGARPIASVAERLLR